MTDNVVVLAAAGSRKTEHIINVALSEGERRPLIMTFTNENRRHIARRIATRAGFPPSHVSLMGWFSFLIGQCAKPYQRALTGAPLTLTGLNFPGERPRGSRKDELRYFIDTQGNLYRASVADFIVQLNAAAEGAVIRRLERNFSHILVDEVQDLSGYDLDVLELLFRSDLRVTVVGDLRQHTLTTHYEPRNKKYRGLGLLNWFEEREDLCTLSPRAESYRCNQAICDFADALYPGLPPTTSVDVEETDHDGIFYVSPDEVPSYFETYRPVVLRHSRTTDTQGLPAMNIGVAKGSTFDRVLIFPTRPMLEYLEHRDETKLKAPERLYVAVTRARWSVAFVVPTS